MAPSSRLTAAEKTAPCDEKFFLHYLGIYAILDRQSTCRCSSMAECQLPKLNTRVRFPSPAPYEKAPKVLIFKHFRGFFMIFEFPVLMHFETLKYNSLLGQLLGQIQLRPLTSKAREKLNAPPAPIRLCPGHPPRYRLQNRRPMAATPARMSFCFSPRCSAQPALSSVSGSGSTWRR